MKSGMIVMQATGAEFIEMPQYVGYWGEPCSHCGLTNTTFEVYPRSIDTNCLACSRPQKVALPDWVMEHVKAKGLR
jgi:hypothetical protein